MATTAARALRRSITAAQTLPRRDLFHRFTTAAAPDAADPSRKEESDAIFVKAPPKSRGSSGEDGSGSVTMPVSFMTGSIVGKRFYKEVTCRESDDGCGWNVMLDYRTLKTPSKRVLKLPSVALANAIAAEWEYQVIFSSLSIHLPSVLGCSTSVV